MEFPAAEVGVRKRRTKALFGEVAFHVAIKWHESVAAIPAGQTLSYPVHHETGAAVSKLHT